MDLLVGALVLLLVLVVICGPWVGLAFFRRRIRDHEQRLQERFSLLTQRIYEIESSLRDLHRGARSAEPQPSAPKQSISTAATKAPVELPEPIEIEPPQTTSAVAPPPPGPPEPITVPTATPPPVHEKTAPSFASAEFGPAIADKIRQSGGVEEILGKNWLNKLGIVLLVIGVAFFLAYQLQTLGPAGKILVGYTLSVALLGPGVWFERNERYRILARAGIAGGWALLFFTTYAMYHVPAAHILSSQAVDLVLMLVVAVAMVWHTLRYNSQVVTGLAFLLAYSTIFLSRVSVYSLSAGIVLAFGIVLITLRRNWFQLEIFGILASYLNHFFWLRPIIEPMGAHKHPFAEFVPSAAILISYWLIFRVSYVVRIVNTSEEEKVSTVAGLLNTIMLMAILKYQSVRPELAFWTLLAFGTVETALGQLAITKRRRSAFVVLSTIGAVLLIAAIPFRYSGAHVSVVWMLEAEVLFLVGIWTGERLFSSLGLLAGFATAGQMLAYEVARVLGRRMDSADLSPDYRVGLLVIGVGAVVLYANAHYVSHRWSEFFSRHIDRRLLMYSSYAGGILATAALWMAFPELWTAVAWSALALALAIASKRFQIPDIALQANAIAALALIRVLMLNFESKQQFHHVSLRLITVAGVAILYYATSRWTGFAQYARNLRIPDAYTWTASTLAAILMWYELEAISVALAWALFGVVLFEIGAHNNKRSLRWQGYVALVSSFLRMFFVNLNAEPSPGEVSARVYTIIPLAVAFFYVHSRRNDVEPSRYERYSLTAQSWMGSITVAALVRFELPTDWVVTGWAAFVLVLLALATLVCDRVFQQQGVLLALAVLFRACFHNFYGRGEQTVVGWSIASVAVIAATLALFAALYFAFRLREVQPTEAEGRIARLWNTAVNRPDQLLFFIPLFLVTVCLALEMRRGLLTVSWGIEAVLVFLFALWIGERTYRLSGLALLLLCVGKIVAVDVWGLNPRDRYVTLIIMGCALLLVSFLYTRYREAIKQYL